MKAERESFDLWFKKNFHDLHEAICCGDLVAKNYKKAMFKAWLASAQREGYKLVPVEPTRKMEMAGMNAGAGFVSKSIYKAMIGASE